MTVALSIPDIARVLTERTANSLLEGIGIALFTWMLLQLLGRRNSSTRFAVWLAALGGIAALPWLSSLGGRIAVSTGGASPITIPEMWASFFFLIWAAITAAMLLRIALSLWRVWQLRRNCQPLSMNELESLPQATLQDIHLTRGVVIAQSDRVSVPTAVGFFKPVILLPAWAITDLSPQELNAILIHELAHLQRHDDWTNLAQNILRAVFFFHPAVWWVDRQLSVEREMACDDVVLAHTSNPRAYAECLISVAEKSLLRRGFALAQAAVGRMHQTSLRISQILDAKRSPATRVWKPALGLVATICAAGVAYVTTAPELIAVRDETPIVATATMKPRSIMASGSLGLPVKALPVSVKTRARAKRVLSRPAAKVPQVNADSLIVEAKLDQSQNVQSQIQIPAATLVVFQQLDRGNGMWTVYVWQLTIVNAAPAQHHIPAKQI